MKLVLILNRDAGALRDAGADAAGDEIASIFRAGGHEVEMRLHAGKEAIAAVESHCEAGCCEALIVGGGDGTISAAAAAAARTGMTLGILPLGTMNLFARSLGIPLDLREAAQALASGRQVGVDIGEVNGRFFVHHVALGLHAKVLRVRERLTFRSRLGKIGASFQAWWIVVRQPPRITASLRIDDKTVQRRTAAILVSNNPLGDGHLPYADNPRQGMLGLYVVKSRSLPELISLAVRLTIGAIAENPHLENWLAEEVDITPTSNVSAASVDGEVVDLQTPVRCRLHPRRLRVLMPQASSS